MNATLQRHSLGLSWSESTGMARAAHAVLDDGHVWLIDPFDDAAAIAAATELGSVAGVIQLLDRHNRDCAALAQRLNVALYKLPAQTTGPFTPIKVIANRAWNEVALWWPQRQALIVPEAVGTVEAFALGRRLGVHPMLRLTPPRRQLGTLAPEVLLVGHGAPLQSDAASALREALDRSRGDAPRLLLALPKLLRSAR